MRRAVPLLAVEWVGLLAGLGALTITEEYRPYVLWALAALAVSFVARWTRTGHAVRRTGMEGPGLLFLAGAGVGLWAAYDRPLALLHLARILAAAVLFYAVADSGGRESLWVAGGLSAAAAVLAVYWPTQHDFFREAPKLGMIAAAGQWINAHAPRIPGPSIHGNVAGGTLTLALPFAAGLACHIWQQRRPVIAAAMIALALVLAGGLFLTGNRSGWLSAAAVACVALLALFQRRAFPGRRATALFWSAAAGLALAVVAGVALTRNLDALLGMVPDPSGAMQGRVHLWSQGLRLIRDYGFTGIGLGAFPMVFSAYGILIDTPFLTHVHNTYLEVWTETGVLGALALIWGGVVALTWAWRAVRGGRATPLAWAGLAALVVIAVHGIFDVAFLATRMFPLVGLAFGYGWLAVRDAEPATHERRPALRWPLAAGLAILVAIAALVFRRPLLSAWHANLGAVEQARVELGLYDPVHFDNPTIDQIRQTASLSTAEQEYARALQWDGNNLTAQQRLSSLALSRGEYAKSLLDLQSLWGRGHRDDVTRLLLGDALVAAGRTAEAAETVRGLTWAEMRLRGQAWYRYWIHKDYRRAADAWTTAILLNPAASKDLANWQAEAEKRAR